MKPNCGEVYYDNKPIYKNLEIKNQVFILPDDPFYSRNTTPTNLIDLYKAFYSVDELAYFSYLNDFAIPIKKSMYNFSKGMRRQVFCALALAIKPKYLFLDEAFDGLDPLARLKLKKELVKAQEENNMTVVISSHSLRELEDICDSYGLLDSKEISSSGAINEHLEENHKSMIAFAEERDEDISKMKIFITCKQDKRIFTVVAKKPYEEVVKELEHLHPLIIDEIPINFEELFIIEVESRGYIK
jgi:ABC-2 type transport system ATP-binding protein